VIQDVEQVAALDVEDNVLEPDAAARPELRFFASSQSKYFTDISVGQCVLDRHTLASRPCAQTRSEDRQSAANANQVPKKNGPEMVNFRPVL
jgi:hypothetical protein